MKISFCYLFILLLVSCSSTKVSNLPTPPPEEWKVPDKDVPKILARLHQCGLFRRCRESAIVDTNKDVYDYAIRTCKGSATISHIFVRYRHADQKNYAKLWGLNHRSETSKVRGYKTQILKVECPNKTVVSYYYYAKLCPPPPNCPSPLDSSKGN